MTVYTYSEATRNLNALLEKSRVEKKGFLIRREDGEQFLVVPVSDSSKSPLDVEGIDIGLTADEIVRLVREQREQ
jgi:hypothetical protein